MQLIYRPDTGEILGVHILGLHAADLIHEASNAMALGTHIQVIIFYTRVFFIFYEQQLPTLIFYLSFCNRI